MRKKVILVMILACLYLCLAPFTAFAEDDLTTMQKYDALKEKGIFAGITGVDEDLDQNMTRAGAARIVALIMGLDLEDTPVQTRFIDVPTDSLFVKEIVAVEAAGIMIGYGNGIFDPEGSITIEQLAKISVEVIGIDTGEFEGAAGASEWASLYVSAALNNGLIPQTDDYTKAATREQLVTAAYAAEKVLSDTEESPESELTELEPMDMPDRTDYYGNAVRFKVGNKSLANVSEHIQYAAKGLPPGVSIDQSSGEISGTLNATGTFEVVIEVTVNSEVLALPTFTWEVMVMPLALRVTVPSLPTVDQTPPTVTLDTYGPIILGESFFATSNEDGYIYLVDVNNPEISSAELEQYYSTSDHMNKTKKVAALANESVEISTEGLIYTDYLIYAVDAAGNVSLPLEVLIWND